MSKVNAYLLQYRDDSIWVATRIVCADGYSLSVQVHEGAYCAPRDGWGPDWDLAEIGFPSSEPTAEIMAYAEDADEPTQTVYGYVPMPLIDALVELHGGFAEDTK